MKDNISRGFYDFCDRNKIDRKGFMACIEIWKQEKEGNRTGCTYGGKGILTYKTSDYYGVGKVINLLEYISDQSRKCKEQNMLCRTSACHVGHIAFHLGTLLEKCNFKIYTD